MSRTSGTHWAGELAATMARARRYSCSQANKQSLTTPQARQQLAPPTLTHTPATSTNPSCDGDNDGVLGDDDKCPGSDAGSVVDARGCSIDQAYPLERPRGMTHFRKNYGQYMSCLAHVTRHFEKVGRISEHERRDIIDEARRSRSD